VSKQLKENNKKGHTRTTYWKVTDRDSSTKATIKCLSSTWKSQISLSS